jgi:hypothetical protein
MVVKVPSDQTQTRTFNILSTFLLGGGTKVLHVAARFGFRGTGEASCFLGGGIPVLPQSTITARPVGMASMTIPEKQVHTDTN